MKIPFNRENGLTNGPANPKYWNFARTVTERRRYLFDEETKRFLDLVRRQCKTRFRRLPKDTNLWRARTAHAYVAVEIAPDEFHHEPVPCPAFQLIPSAQHTLAGGRANPPGIAYLYLCSSPEAALAEARPALNQLVTVGIFKSANDLNIAVLDHWPDDANILLPPTDVGTEVPAEAELWKDLAETFSAPVSRDNPICYVPTQIIAELFLSEDADGIAYRSRLGEGTNIVLFDFAFAPPTDPFQCFLYSPSKITLEFKVEGVNGIYLRGEKKLTMVSTA